VGHQLHLKKAELVTVGKRPPTLRGKMALRILAAVLVVMVMLELLALQAVPVS
jgi:hypothetical protein